MYALIHRHWSLLKAGTQWENEICVNHHHHHQHYSSIVFGMLMGILLSTDDEHKFTLEFEKFIELFL